MAISAATVASISSAYKANTEEVNRIAAEIGNFSINFNELLSESSVGNEEQISYGEMEYEEKESEADFSEETDDEYYYQEDDAYTESDDIDDFYSDMDDDDDEDDNKGFFGNMFDYVSGLFNSKSDDDHQEKVACEEKAAADNTCNYNDLRGRG